MDPPGGEIAQEVRPWDDPPGCESTDYAKISEIQKTVLSDSNDTEDSEDRMPAEEKTSYAPAPTMGIKTIAENMCVQSYSDNEEEEHKESSVPSSMLRSGIRGGLVQQRVGLC